MDETHARSRTIVAVAEGRRNTCGLAEVDLQYPLSMSLCATSESSSSWHDTLNTISRLAPDVVLIPISQRNSELSTTLQDELVSCQFEFLGRKSFNQAAGLSEFERLTMSYMTNPTYLVCAALKAVVDFAGNVEDVIFADCCIEFVSVSPSGRLLMDRATLENLEIVRNRRTGNRKGSLFDLFAPSSGLGARLLKKTLMSPVAHIDTLNGRYDTVALLLQNTATLRKLRQKLNRTNLEQICRLLAFIPRTHSNLNCARSIGGVLGLVDILRSLPSLATIVSELLQGATTTKSKQLLQESVTNLSNPLFADMLAMIREGMALSSLDDDSSESGSQGRGYNVKQRREIFCISPGTSGPLDVSRATYLQCLQAIDTLFDQYVTSWSIVGMELRHEKKTIVIRMPLSSEHLPHDLDITRKTKKYMCGTTKELGSLVKRVQECVAECYHHTFVEIQSLLTNIRNQIKAIASIADTLAFLDLVGTFATLSSFANYTRPFITSSAPQVGTIAIKQGRHPVAERMATSERYIPNDVLLTSGRNFQLVLGPNSSGKSTYLRTVACTVILAQCGCFVPALKCSIQLRDRILSRLSCEDDTEKNLSTFQLEASEAAYITRSLTSNSLILFDEFGRSTSSKEALSLSYATAEFLMNTPALSLFATHFQELQSLSTTTENCFTSYFKFSEDSKSHTRHYSHKLMFGNLAQSNVHYGIEHARFCGWQASTVQKAKQVRNILVNSGDSNATTASLNSTRQSARGSWTQIIQTMAHTQKSATTNQAALPVIKELLRSLQRSKTLKPVEE